MNERAHNIVAIDFLDTTVNIAIIAWQNAKFPLICLKLTYKLVSFDLIRMIRFRSAKF